MKLSNAPTKIAGVATGEFSSNLVGTGPLLKVKFALITKDQGVAGFVERSADWSDKTLEALRVFTEAIEEEGMMMIFDEVQASETPKADNPNEPQQF